MDEMSLRIGPALLAGNSLNIVGRPGTGKTTLLESVYAELVTQIDPASVLVLTPDRNHADVLRNRLQPPADAVLSRPRGTCSPPPGRSRRRWPRRCSSSLCRPRFPCGATMFTATA